jgi:hypothetical protein
MQDCHGAERCRIAPGNPLRGHKAAEQSVRYGQHGLRVACPAAITLIPQRTARCHETVIKRLLQGIVEETLVARTARRTQSGLGSTPFRLEDLDRSCARDRKRDGQPGGQRTLEQLHSSSDHVLIPQDHQFDNENSSREQFSD